MIQALIKLDKIIETPTVTLSIGCRSVGCLDDLRGGVWSAVITFETVDRKTKLGEVLLMEAPTN